MTSSSSNRTSLFRPCIDIHSGLVKQIVGSSLKDTATEELLTNFVATHPPSYYSNLYKQAGLTGAHVIKLGGGELNDEAAKTALNEWKDGLQVGGGMNADNARQWLENGASKIIVTSYLFPDCKFSLERLESLSNSIGRDRLVVDVSCRKKDGKWIVAMNRWQDLTDMEVNQESINLLSKHCSEFLIHAADVEGLCKGIDEELVEKLGEWCSIPTTYAGGARHLGDLELVNQLSTGKVDLTFGSALDIFGGNGVTLDEVIQWNRKAGQSPP